MQFLKSHKGNKSSHSGIKWKRFIEVGVCTLCAGELETNVANICEHLFLLYLLMVHSDNDHCCHQAVKNFQYRYRNC